MDSTRDRNELTLFSDEKVAETLGIAGEYMELVKSENNLLVRRIFGAVLRSAEHAHRIILFKPSERRPIPAWTLFITGPKVREWGLHCPQDWRHWRGFCGVPVGRAHGHEVKVCQ